MNNEKQFEALFNYATIGIIITDTTGTVFNVNKKAEEDFGYTEDEIKGKQVEILLPHSVRVKHEHYREDFYKHPSSRAMGAGRDLFGCRKDGSVFPVEVSLSHYTVDGSMFVMAFVIDITIRKNNEATVLAQKAELEKITKEIKQLNINLERKVEDRTQMLRETLGALERSKEELSGALKTERELGELKSRFVTMASHEFKTPLSTILSSSFLLEKYNEADAPGKRMKHIERIKNAVDDMKNILDDFLSLGKLEEGLVRANIQTITAAEGFNEIGNVINEMKVHCKKGQEICFTHTGENAIRIDRHFLKNILSNLLSNAIKFSPENSTISITCTITDHNFVLKVKDKGIGIAEEDKQHLFDRFFRAKNAVNIQGTGLGLHIISKYLELMQGSIQVKSVLNEGSEFSIYIPQLNDIGHEKDFNN
ncbi:MAG TPA: PAS domain-containing sensor histidine kinase [Parafilimonas sp.]|nr:PAS domain-containing sensor histidine kinase [Parafilimonas sp.]